MARLGSLIIVAYFTFAGCKGAVSDPAATSGDDPGSTQVSDTKATSVKADGFEAVIQPNSVGSGATVSVTETDAPSEFATSLSGTPVSNAYQISAIGKDGAAINVASEAYSLTLDLTEATSLAGGDYCVLAKIPNGSPALIAWLPNELTVASGKAVLSTYWFGIYQAMACDPDSLAEGVPSFTVASQSVKKTTNGSSTPNGVPGDDGTSSAYQAPTGLTASAEYESEESYYVQLNWHPVNELGVDYEVLSSTKEAGPYSKIATVQNDITYQVREGLAAGKTHYFKVRAKGERGVGAESSAASALLRPAAPQHLVGVASGTGASLSWDAVVGATSYVIYGGTTIDTAYQKLGEVTVRSFSIMDLGSGQDFTFRVVAQNGAGPGPEAVVEVLTNIETPVLSTMQTKGTVFELAVTNSPTSAHYSWWIAGDQDGPFFPIVNDASTLTHSGGFPGETYYVKVSVSVQETTVESAVETVTMTGTSSATLDAVAGLSLTSSSPNSILVEWTLIADPNKDVQFFISDSLGGVYAPVAWSGGAFTYKEISGLAANTEYCIKVRQVEDTSSGSTFAADSGNFTAASCITTETAPGG